MVLLPSKNALSLATGLKQRRAKLARLINYPVILWSGSPLGRNFSANKYPFRSSSHFLYFAGIPLPNAAIYLKEGRLELYLDNPPPSATLWHGETPDRAEIGEAIGADAVYPLNELSVKTPGAATIAVQDSVTYQQQCQLLNRFVPLSHETTGIDLELARAIVKLRSHHDDLALQELRQASSVSVKAHQAGMAATSKAKSEAEIRSGMEGVIIASNMTCAYNSIVTVRGEVLHNETYQNPLQPGDLLLADVGAETPNGWAADITRTWAVSGKFSSTQKDIYEVVLQAHDDCIAKIEPGVEYQDIHLLAAEIITRGLVDLGILKGNVEDLVAMDAHALFFPHGVGHLLGLDVHDMEDLGDEAGYETGRSRSDRFGLSYLRLNRPLQPGMLVTIEPGFYQVPAILNHPDFRHKYRHLVNWERLAQFKDVKGIRIEDDVLVTDFGTEVLTADLPTKIEDMEKLVL
ncbi:aminopeptidase P family protein [Waterburya agarophytonicola K14]|uniref:Xaa-Pro aminopeptidase n=1 Tax=Waterburya agarophytonicola KI4 TaxID=2874699 RepID=A0A964BRU6_9CYAN|nr:aminopeptidase P family protein [Waterburya agarophytonicola]MCC0177046.1 aminopeptidase P family protein [Waterburya agarophytonicola KI4]